MKKIDSVQDKTCGYDMPTTTTDGKIETKRNFRIKGETGFFQLEDDQTVHHYHEWGGHDIADSKPLPIDEFLKANKIPANTGVNKSVLDGTESISEGTSSLSKTSSVPGNRPSGFHGQQTGIGSWFSTNERRDENMPNGTNGKGYFGNPYFDNQPVVAIDISQMSGGATYGSTAYKKAEKEYLGQEVKITNNKTGKTVIGVVGDAFAHPRGPGAIDMSRSLWTTLNGGNFRMNHNDVLNVSWEFTEKRSTMYD